MSKMKKEKPKKKRKRKSFYLKKGPDFILLFYPLFSFSFKDFVM
jgi:hypothetical protein